MDATENIIYKKVESLAKYKARKIDNAFKKVLPKWQWKLLMITKSHLLGRLLGWELRVYIGTDKFEIWNRNKRCYKSR